MIYKPGGLPERTEALRQVQGPKAADSAVDAVLKLRTWRRWLTRLGDLGGSKPDPAMQIQALEVITGPVLKSMGSVSFRVKPCASFAAVGHPALPMRELRSSTSISWPS